MVTNNAINTIENNQRIDLHTHILPGLDDGSPDPATSIQMLRKEYEQSIDTVVLTPHFYAREYSPDEFLKKREQALTALIGAITQEKTSFFPNLILGAEVLYFEGMSFSPELRKLCISGTELLLLELPYGPWSKRMLSEISGIRDKLGIVPIIAHLDRYNTKGYPVKEILNMNVLIQLNSESIISWRRSRWALNLIKSGRINLLASDCHNTDTRAPTLDKAFFKIEKKLGTDIVEHLSKAATELLLDAERIEGIKMPL